jgi:hypothetical protein
MDRAGCRALADLFLRANAVRHPQQSAIKTTANSIRYATKRLSARGTTLKTSIITITYTIRAVSGFQEYFRGTLKTHAKVQRSRPVCWHFCWYRAN